MTEDARSTKERLLDAAEQMFADRGFDGVSIRELAAEARVNVAAINYHFHGKQKLFEAVLVRHLSSKRERTLAAIAEVVAAGDGHPDLRALIRSFVSEYLQEALALPQGDTFLRLLARQMHEPRHGGDIFFAELVVPVNRAFSDALARARPDLDRERIAWIIASIVGQVLHFIMRWRRGRPEQADSMASDIPLTIFPPLTAPLDQYISQVVEHVTEFSLRGIGEAVSPV